MVVINIIIGLVGLGIVILVHETGHFAAAKLFGIDVETFSLGWGRKLFGFTKNGTDYRISMIPIGGYCKMKGEQILRKAIEDDEKSIPQEPGSFYSASPWKRMGVAVAGPIFNLVFAALVFSLIWLIGFKVHSYDSKVILVSEYSKTSELFAADRAGLATGDIVTILGNRNIGNYNELQEAIALNGGKTLDINVMRDGRDLSLSVTLGKDEKTGIGMLGVYAWIDPIIGEVFEGSSAHVAGFKPGDRIAAVNGLPVAHTVDFLNAFDQDPGQATITYERNGALYDAVLQIPYNDANAPDFGFAFAVKTFKSGRLSLFQAFGKGFTDAGTTLSLTIRSIGMLFQGINVREAVSGPIRITYYIGETASYGFKFGLGGGLSTLFRFLSLLSVAVFVMNLLPIPALDGGLFILSLIEGVTRRPLKPKAVYRYQVVGFSIIIALVIFTTFNDVFFFIKR